MNLEHYFAHTKIIISRIESAKSISKSIVQHRYKIFKVATWANKHQIKNAIEELFEKVQVTKVRTILVKGTQRTFRGKIGHTKTWKKAYIQLKPGFDINFSD